MLQRTERFQNDVKHYTQAIDQITDSHRKLEAKKLLNDLIYEVKNMDNMYLDLVYNKQLPSLGGDMKNKITEIRKNLDKLIKTAG